MKEQTKDQYGRKSCGKCRFMVLLKLNVFDDSIIYIIDTSNMHPYFFIRILGVVLSIKFERVIETILLFICKNSRNTDLTLRQKKEIMENYFTKKDIFTVVDCTNSKMSVTTVLD